VVEKAAGKAARASDRLDKVENRIPKKQVRRRTVDPNTGRVTVRLSFEEKKPPSNHAIKGDWGRRPQQAKGKVGTTLPCLPNCSLQKKWGFDTNSTQNPTKVQIVFFKKNRNIPDRIFFCSICQRTMLYWLQCKYNGSSGDIDEGEKDDGRLLQ